MTLPTDTIYFCVCYLVWLALVTLASLEFIRRFRQPVTHFVVGLLAICLSFWFVMSSVPDWRMGQEMYQFQITYHYFRAVAFIVFLGYFVARGGYLLSRIFSCRADNTA